MLNKFYAGPGPHDILGGDGILGGRRVDWADQGETPPVSIDAGVQFLPREVIPKPELPPLPRSVAEATAECQTLYERYWPELRPRLLAALPPPDGSPVTVAADPQRPLANTVAQLLAAVDRDGVAVLANAVPLDICDTIMTELSQYTYTTSGALGSVVRARLSLGSGLRFPKIPSDDLADRAASSPAPPPRGTTWPRTQRCSGWWRRCSGSSCCTPPTARRSTCAGGCTCTR